MNKLQPLNATPIMSDLASTASPQDAPIQLLSFSLAAGNELFALDLGHIREIVKAPHITPLPGALCHQLGLVALRGKLLSVFDLAALILGKPGPTEGGVLIVSDFADTLRAYLVRDVETILRVNATEIRPLEDDTMQASEFIRGVLINQNEKLVSLLDLVRLSSVLMPQPKEHLLAIAA